VEPFDKSAGLVVCSILGWDAARPGAGANPRVVAARAEMRSRTMRAVVIAAGDGGRLFPLTSDVPKPLLKVQGRPIIAHVLASLAEAGVDEVVVVAGYRGDQMRLALGSWRPRGMSLRFVQNDDYMLGNARSLWAARHAAGEAFLLAMGDHLIEPGLAAAVTAGGGGRCRLAVERTGPDDSRAGEATRALVRDGCVVELGKRIDRWNALDTGVFWCTQRVFDVMTGAERAELRDGEAGAVFALLAREGELDAVDVSGHRWIDIDTPEDLLRADAMFGANAPLREGHAGVA